MAELGRVPQVGDRVETPHAVPQVEALRGFAVHSVRIIDRADGDRTEGRRECLDALLDTAAVVLLLVGCGRGADDRARAGGSAAPHRHAWRARRRPRAGRWSRGRDTGPHGARRAGAQVVGHLPPGAVGAARGTTVPSVHRGVAPRDLRAQRDGQRRRAPAGPGAAVRAGAPALPRGPEPAAGRVGRARSARTRPAGAAVARDRPRRVGRRGSDGAARQHRGGRRHDRHRRARARCQQDGAVAAARVRRRARPAARRPARQGPVGRGGRRPRDGDRRTAGTADARGARVAAGPRAAGGHARAQAARGHRRRRVRRGQRPGDDGGPARGAHRKRRGRVRPVGTWRRRTSRGVLVLPGTLRPDELADAVGVALPEGAWETVAGYVLAQLGHLPTAGDCLATDVGVFTISRMDGYRITEIELRARHRST